jgi:hypothetical protein
MSESKCSCYWCKKNVSEADATQIRVDFITDSFKLFFQSIFKVEPAVAEVVGQNFKSSVFKFIDTEVTDADNLFYPILDLSFVTIGLESELTPTDIFKKCDLVFNGVITTLKALSIDNRVAETPILNKKLTPAMLVEYELNDVDLPEDVIKIYNDNTSSSIKGILTELQSSFAETGGDICHPTVH